MEEKIWRIGIMGGTFDPIHYGHLVLAETVRDDFGLDRIIFLPSGDPPHKKHEPVTPAASRLEMVRLAVEGNPGFEVSPMEVERKGYSYTYDTMKAMNALYPDNHQFFFITGADAILEILAWKEVDRLSGLCSFIAATRPGTEIGKLSAFLDSLPESLRSRIHLTQVPPLEISSTGIRKRIRENKSITYLLPPAVEEYIRKEGLYRD